ncbi:MAG: FBP domain-containing protein [Deltaproteobacteria bacterium]|nr:FBP domain-containing protein [Deltaproteobacteria bacterium]
MFRLENEDTLLATFRPKDREAVRLAPEVKFPTIVRHYLAWVHPAGGRVFLVFQVPGGAPTGIVFDTSDGADPSVPQMCDWCHNSAPGTGVGLLTARRNAKKNVGVHICSDLSCRQKLEEDADRRGVSVLPMMEKLVQRMGRFASEALQIDLSGAGR